MFDAIIKFSLRYRVFVVFAYIIIIIIWARSLTKIPVDVLPDLNKPRVTVFAESDGLGAQEVEELLTTQLERNFSTIPGVELVRSSSALWIAVINIEFNRWTPSLTNRQLVNEKIATLEVQDWVHISMAPEWTLMGEILRIGLSAKDPNVTQEQLRGIAESTLRQAISTTPWVANIIIMGGAPKQYNIMLDPTAMIARGIHIEQIEQALQEVTVPGGGWVVIQPSTEFPVSLTAAQWSVKTLSNLTIGSSEQWTKILLSDVARITEWWNAQKRGDAMVNADPGVVIRINKTATANTLLLTEELTNKLTALESSLPKWVILHKELFKQSNFIVKWLQNVQNALLEAILIVMLIVAMFLMNIRTTLIVVFSLPITLLLTALIFKWLGIGINIMTLWWLTIAIWELVDDAIVDMENIYRRLRENYLRPLIQQKSIWYIIYHASTEVRWSVVYATILQLIVFVPFLLLPGIDGRLLAPIWLWYLISLFMSLLVAITFVPIVCSYILPSWIQKKYFKKYPELYSENSNNSISEKEIEAIIHKEEDTRLTKKLKSLVHRPVNRSINNPKKALLLALITLPITIGLYLQTEKAWLPPFNETSFTIGIATKPGSSLEFTKKVAEQFSKKLKNIPGIHSTATMIWRADADAHALWSNSAEIEAEMGIDVSNTDKIRMEKAINKIVEEFRGMAIISVWQPITHRVEELVSGVRAPVVIKLYGQNLDELERIGKLAVEKIKKINWVRNASLETQTKVPSIKVSPNITNQSSYGIPYTITKELLQVGIGGKQVAEVVDGQLRYPVVMMFEWKRKESVQSLSQIPVESDAGQQTTLWSLLKIEESKARNMISHENGQRRIIIQSYTDGRWVVDVMEDIKKEFAEIDLPEWYRFSYEWLYQAQKESSFLLMIVGIFVIMWVCGILFMHYSSWLIVWQIMLWVFTGRFGGMIGVFATGGVLSTAHMVWFISLMGIVVRNGIMLIDHYKHLHDVDKMPRWKELLIKWSLERAVPVAMTALAAVLWLLPLVLWSSETWKEILAPIAIVIFFWLIVSTFIEFFIRPGVFYKYNNIWTQKEEKKEISFDN